MREQYLKESLKYTFSKKYYDKRLKKLVEKPTKSIDDERLFPISMDTAHKRWKKLLLHSHLNQRCETTLHKVHEMRVHSLRRFFKSRMESANIPQAIINKMVGHKFYLSDEYSVHELEELKENYKIGEQQLLLYDENKEVKQMQKQYDKELDKLKKQVKEQSEVLKNLDNKTLQKLIMTLKDGRSLEDVIKEYFGRTNIDKWEKLLYKVAQEEKEGK